MAETIVPDLMTIDELINRLGLGRTKVNELHKTNELPFPTVRIGGRVMFSRRAYEAWLQQYDYKGGGDSENRDGHGDTSTRRDADVSRNI